MVSNKEHEEKEYYRKRLRQWRDLGFDTRELEVMLETDFDRLKEMKFDKLRDQLKMMTSEESIPDISHKEPRTRRPSHRIEVPHIREAEDGKMEEGEGRDHLADIRAEMARRKMYEELKVHDLAGEFDDAPRSRRKEPLPEEHEDYPLISFGGAKKEGTRKSVLDETDEKTVRDEMLLLEEEAAIIRKKKQLLEAEEARLHRKKRLLAEIEEHDPEAPALDLYDEDEDMDASKEEPALIFVGRGREGPEDEDEEEDEEEEDTATITVTPIVEEGADDVEEEEEDDHIEEEAPRPKRRRKAAAVTVTPVKKKAKKVAKVRTGPVRKKVKKKVRRQRYTAGDDRQSYYAIAFAIVIIIIIASLATFMFVTPKLEAKITADKDSATIGDVITFNGRKSKGSNDIDSYKWDFGDGTTAKTMIHKKTYTKAGDYTVKLTVKDDTGATASTTLKVTITELKVVLPSKMIGDDGRYDVEGMLHLENEKDGLYSVPNPIQPGATIKIVSMHLDYTGTMASNIKGVSPEEDGFSEVHQTLHREVVQDLEFQGKAYTNYGATPADVTGDVDLRQQVYVDLKTNHSVKTATTSHIETDPITIGGFTVSPAVQSDDDLRSYPDLATVDNQVSIEDLFALKTMDTNDPTTLQGQVQKGSPPDTVVYSWKYDGVDNVYNRPAIHLNVTLDQNTLSKLSLTTFWVDIWVANDIPTYVKIHTYLEGANGTTDYRADSTATMNSFTKGSAAITGTCGAQHYDPLHPSALFDNFNRTPPEGDPNATSHLFSPQEAMEEAMVKSSAFRTFMNTGLPFAIGGNYSEKNGPTWNLTFGNKGSTRGYTIIVSWTGSDYNVMAQEVDIDAPGLSREDLPSLLTLETAEVIFKSDAKVKEELYTGGIVDYDTATLFLDIETPYPNLDFTLTSISATEVPYTYSISKHVGQGTASEKIFSVVINAENGQMMYVQQHTGAIPLPFRIP